MQIEGRVEGEPDNRQTESGNAFDAAQAGGAGAISNIIGEDIRTTIDRGDMEQLAALVLNGEGAQLVGMESKQPEIQAFLDNVPAYMVRRLRKETVTIIINFFLIYHSEQDPPSPLSCS